jgi:hypothetical protein
VEGHDAHWKRDDPIHFAGVVAWERLCSILAWIIIAGLLGTAARLPATEPSRQHSGRESVHGAMSEFPVALQPEHRRGLRWDPRLPAVLVFIVVASCGLPAVWNSHWMWIDDQMVVGAQLWPPDSILNQKWHTQGREFIAHGLYFKLLSLIFPLHPFWYYLTNYVTHIAVVGLAAWVVWRATKSGAATALCALTAGLASTGPEVFLTLLKQELHMTLWLLVALLLVQRLLRPDCSWRAGTLIALAIATFLSGTLGKENFVILTVGLVAALTCVALTGTRLRLAGRPFAALVATSIGTTAVFAERHLLGTRSIADGGYTGSLLVLRPTLSAALERETTYRIQTGDVLVLVVVAAIACVGCLAAAIYRRRDLTSAQVPAITCAAAAVAQVVFNVVFLAFVQIYYLYPAATLGTVSLACLWPTSGHVGAGRGPAIWKWFGRTGLTAVLAGTAILTLPTFIMRVYAQNVIPTMEWHLMQAIAAMPPRSMVLLGFPRDAEMIENASVLLQHELGRSDISIESALDPANAVRLSAAYAERRPVFLAFVYEPGENWTVGVRGAEQKSRAEILALAASHGIDHICPDLQQSLGPPSTTVWRFFPSLHPILKIKFGYAWELDRVPPPSPGAAGCGSR